MILTSLALAGRKENEPWRRPLLYGERFAGMHIDMPKAPVEHGFSMAIEYFREEDSRWLADIPALPGVTSYGRTKKQATVAVQALALRLIAGRLEHGEALPGPMNVTFVAA
jgi:predicted RNase H-like HicB family nuclease